MTFFRVEYTNNENRSFPVSVERNTFRESYRDFEALSRIIPETHLSLVSVETSVLPLQKPEEEELPF